ncbi:hypothetical protein OIU79_026307 [Salix purpurea]|uniref:Uncharacterized protein n=1 Tax=Salix purpurea TaxID=77065 RepID=A0A9Q0VR40_SALPP|nr:hypothetical protein OIU79_026307 [Salix purpurea]
MFQDPSQQRRVLLHQPRHYRHQNHLFFSSRIPKFSRFSVRNILDLAKETVKRREFMEWRKQRGSL